MSKSKKRNMNIAKSFACILWVLSFVLMVCTFTHDNTAETVINASSIAVFSICCICATIAGFRRN